jgi:murein DD-endopeptidase MepM/ murein hydrolase activator NlpD
MLRGYLSLVALLTVISCNNQIENNSVSILNSPDTLNNNPKRNQRFEFGIPADSFVVFYGRIRPNRFLPDLLSDYGITLQDIDNVLRNSSKVFNIREMRAGNHFTILAVPDSMKRAKYFIYEHDPSLYYIFSFNDSLNITPFRLKVNSEIKFVSGTIVSSLWEAMAEAGLNPELCISMSDIYAWTVDFFGLQKGDGFKVIYEEHFIGKTPWGIGRIYGAEFDHGGKKIFAIPLIQNGVESFYDTTGNSLRKAFLKAPLKYPRVSSRFSSGRMHPILRIVRPHFGVDYAAPIGTPVLSIGDGTVVSAGIENESGRIVRIKHNSVYTTAYLHLSSFGNGINPGANIKQGDIVGYVGTSGLATGPHLDFRFYKNGYAVDPLKVEAPTVEPVLPENLERFEKTKMVILNLLNTIE